MGFARTLYQSGCTVGNAVEIVIRMIEPLTLLGDNRGAVSAIMALTDSAGAAQSKTVNVVQNQASKCIGQTPNAGTVGDNMCRVTDVRPPRIPDEKRSYYLAYEFKSEDSDWTIVAGETYAVSGRLCNNDGCSPQFSITLPVCESSD